MNLLSSLILLGSLTLTLGCRPKPGAINIARNGEASQSPVYVDEVMGYANKAIDGVKDTNHFNGFCAHTEGIENPWWRLDLKQTYNISNVVITNRMDYSPERLLGAEVRIGNNPNNNNPVCGKVTDVKNAELSFCCNGMEGQYVSLVIPGRQEFLCVCEVEVYADLVTEEKGTNIARNGEASLSLVYIDEVMGYANKAIDGVKDTNHFNGFCAHTEGIENPWWRLDLKQTYNISNVVITNRMDCCPERLLGAEVRIGNNPDNNNPVCGKVMDVANAELSFFCNGMEGQYVSLVIPGRQEFLCVCEVEVYADLVTEEKGTNIARNGEASQSPVYVDEVMGYAYKAIDGVKDTNHFNGFCAHTEGIENPWWRLDLKQIYKISNIVITNRMDCCPERLLGAEVRIGNNPENNNPVCGNVTDVMNAELSFCCNGMDGQYVSLVIPGRQEFLCVCEVEVYGDLVTEEKATNIARNGEASQSLVYIDNVMGYANKAIDGVKDTNHFHGFCAQTALIENPWWRLDLKQIYKISNVIVTNRMDYSPERLLGAEVRIGNNPDNNNPVCGTVTDVANAELSFCCGRMEGQYVSLVITGRTDVLCVCEVEVYGDLVTEEKALNIARNGEASQLLVYIDEVMGYANKAIDGVKDTNHFHGFCAQTAFIQNPWWRLDLKQTYKISNVVVTNRMDYSPERLLGTEVRIGNNPDNNNPVCGTVTDVANAELSFPCNKMEGQYVSLVILGRTDVLCLCEVEVYADLVTEEKAINIARNGEASQSPVYVDEVMGYANKAIDGVKDTNHFNGFCAHTVFIVNPWWRLDLKQIYKISNVIVTNRMDCCPERLLGAEVRIGNNPDNNNPVCGNITDVANAELSFSCNGMEGQYVSLVIPGRKEFLCVCEVEVYGDLVTEEKATNIARNGEASQSPVYIDEVMGYANKAIDGVKDTNHSKGFCAHTEGMENPWWRLDLKQIYKISNVIVTNRMDCCPERLLGAEVRIGNNPDNNNPVCGKVMDVTNAELSFCCNRMKGQYVSLVIPGRKEFLCVCEVEVYGDLVTEEKATNIARNGEASQVSPIKDFIQGKAENAIDGSKNGYITSGSCTHPNEVKDPWWKLDLKQTYKISNIVLTNRQDCCAERLLGAEVRIGNDPDNNNPVCGIVTDVANAELPFFCNGMEGQYVSVVIPGRTVVLTLCEVEVYGDLACW